MPTKSARQSAKWPENFGQLKRGDQRGYEIRTGYFLELDHDLDGLFPALFKGTERMVITLDPELLKEVWETLPPRRSKESSLQFYVSEELSVAFPMHDRGEPIKLLNREKFKELTNTDSHPFEWAPGLVSNDMSRAEFIRTIRATAERHSITLPAA
ncbi:hypothetical protein D4R51_03935 [bacterium]|nr:MAG: hypothetical protein D4R51_03935 [bacterium]